MAIIQCPNCGKPISDKAPKCPKCGTDMESKPQQPAAEPAAPSTQTPPSLQTENYDEQDIMPEKRNKSIYWIIGSILLAVMAGGGCYFLGHKHVSDYEHLSETELIKLHDKGDVEATLQLGRQAIHDMDLEEAKSYFQQAADQNNPVGLHNLAAITARENLDTAISYLERAINLGFQPSKGVLAYILNANPGMGRTDEGFKLAKEAAANGDKYGYYAMGIYYLPENMAITEGDECYTYTTKSIEAGCAWALLARVSSKENGGIPVEDVIEHIEKYKVQFPRLADDLITALNGGTPLSDIPYYSQGFFIIEDLMQ